jgi:hypothetical protein
MNSIHKILSFSSLFIFSYLLISADTFAQSKSNRQIRTFEYLVSAQTLTTNCSENQEVDEINHIGSIRIRNNSIVLKLSGLPVFKGRINRDNKAILTGAQFNGLTLQRYEVEITSIAHTSQRNSGIPVTFTAPLYEEYITGASIQCTAQNLIELYLGKKRK